MLCSQSVNHLLKHPWLFISVCLSPATIMHLVKSLLLLASTTPLVLAGPRGRPSCYSIPLILASWLTLYTVNHLRRQAGNGELPRFTHPFDHWLAAAPSATNCRLSILFSNSCIISSPVLLTNMCNTGNSYAGSSSLPTTDLTPSSSVPANAQSSLTFVGTAPLGTAISSAPQTTQEVVLTDV